MAQNTQTFILVGDFKDNITPKLKRLNRELNKFSKDLNKSLKGSTKGIEKDIEKLTKNAEKNFKAIGKGFDKAIGDAGRSVGKLESSLNDAGRAAGKVRDTVSQIGEGLKGFDGLTESMDGVARAAGRAQDEVLGIGSAAGRANKQADDLMTTLLKAEGLSKFGDAMSQGFGNSMNAIVGTAQKGAGVVGKAFKDAMDDELADIKAASGIQGSFGMAGFKGDFTESQKMYKKYDQVVSEMIRQSSAPTAKVVELQRYTLDTMGPLMLAAQGVKKGTAMKDIDPKKIEASAKQYGAFLEKAALFSQGTGSAGFRVAAGIEQLVTRGKIDTTIDFFTDNIMLMKNLEAAGFMGRGRGTSKLMNATDAQRMAAMMEAFNKSMSSESTAAMAQSLTGSLQGLQDTIFNPSVGILGMAVTFTKDEQKAANASIKKIMDARIKGYQKELKNVKISEKRREELNNSIAQATATRDKLLKEDTISTPFKAFSFAFTNLVQGLTNALNAIGPVWTELSIAMIDVTNKVFAPLTETLANVASDMRGGKYTQMEGFGRILGEIFKTIGQIFADLAKMMADPNSALGKAQSEFMKGFMDAFKEPGSLEKAKKGLSDGLNALVGKIFSSLMAVITSETMRPIVLPFMAMMFGPPVIGAIISGITPLLITSAGKFFIALFARAQAMAIANSAAGKAATAAKAAAAARNASIASAALGAAGRGGAAATAAGAAATGGTAAAAGGGGAVAGLSAVPIWGWIAALAAAVVIFEKPIMAFTKMLESFAVSLTKSQNWLTSSFGHVLKGITDLIDGVVKFFNGLWEIVSGLLTGDVDRVVGGIKKLFAGIADTIVGIGGVVGGFGGMIIGAIGNLFNAIKGLIDRAWRKILNLPTPEPDKNKTLTPDQTNRYNAAVRQWTARGGKDANGKAVAKPTPNQFASAFGSPGAKFTSLNDAVNYEMKNKPKGSDLVIANSSETIIPAADGLGSMKGVIDAIWRSGAQVAATTMKGFDDLRATIATGDAKNAAATTRTGAMTKSAIDRSIAVSMAGDAKIMNAIKAASAAGGFGGAGGPLGSGSGSLGAASALAQSMGLQITSGYRPGDPGYHGVNRARDYSNSTGPTPQMLKFAQTMAAKYGSSMKELIYTPLGFGIKNGKKVAPYATAAHYNHVHVAFARGLNNPTMFSSATAAAAYEKMMAPAGAKVATVTANSSEHGGGHTTVNQNITINGAQDPQRLAEMVFDYASRAAQRVNNASFA